MPPYKFLVGFGTMTVYCVSFEGPFSFINEKSPISTRFFLVTASSIDTCKGFTFEKKRENIKQYDAYDCEPTYVCIYIHGG